MIEISVKNASEKLGDLLDLVEKGERLLIKRSGSQVAALTAVPKNPRKSLKSLKSRTQGIAQVGRTASKNLSSVSPSGPPFTSRANHSRMRVLKGRSAERF